MDEDTLFSEKGAVIASRNGNSLINKVLILKDVLVKERFSGVVVAHLGVY